MPPDSQARQTSEHERDESPSERADRNFVELVQELRVAQTGVQILFGFLLAVSFTDAFQAEQTVDSVVLTVALLSAMLAALCFMAPVVAHRMHFRQGAKERLVWITHRLVVAGMVAFAATMELGLWLVLARVWSDTTASVVCLAMVPVIVAVWVVWPGWALRERPGG